MLEHRLQPPGLLGVDQAVGERNGDAQVQLGRQFRRVAFVSFEIDQPVVESPEQVAADIFHAAQFAPPRQQVQEDIVDGILERLAVEPESASVGIELVCIAVVEVDAYIVVTFQKLPADDSVVFHIVRVMTPIKRRDNSDFVPSRSRRR